MISTLIKYGSAFTAGYIAGGTVEQATRPSKKDDDPFQVWRGKTREIEWEHESAEDLLGKIEYWLDHPETEEKLSDRHFWEDDLKDIRRKILHRDLNGETFTIELTDRERLLLYDLTMATTITDIHETLRAVDNENN